MNTHIILDEKTRTATREGKKIKLSQKEYLLVEFLIENKNNIVHRKKLLKHIWKYAPDVETRVVDVYVGYLRRKIDTPFSNKLLHSVRGLGYICKL